MKNPILTACFVSLVFLTSPGISQTPADSAAKLTYAPKFDISAEDEAAGIDGILKIAVDVNKSGEVTNAVVYIGPVWPCDGDLDNRVRQIIKDVEKAVRNFKFSPQIKDGKPVATRLGLTMSIGRSSREKATKPSPPDPNAPKDPKLVTGGVVNGKAISLPKPSYPYEARGAGAGGAVSVQVLISEEGKVISAQAVDGHPLLQFAARAAACQARFSPTRLEGHPVKVSGIITYNFVP
jgi:TonB family protein